MKGITCCGECAYYSMKKHKCTRGAKDPGKATDSFYADCPFDDTEPVRHGRWVHHNGGYSDHFECTACGEDIVLTGKWRFCPNCGAYMREVKEDAGTD